jgi:hypothetical protein
MAERATRAFSRLALWNALSLALVFSERRDSLETVLLLLNEPSFSNMLSY